jgi:hypothetical protein
MSGCLAAIIMAATWQNERPYGRCNRMADMSRYSFQGAARNVSRVSLCLVLVAGVFWAQSYFGRWSLPAVVGGNRPQVQSADGHLYFSWVQTHGPGPWAVKLQFSATRWQTGAPYPWIRLVQGPLPPGSGTIVAPTLVFEPVRLKNAGFDRGTIRLNTGNRFLIVRVASVPYWPFAALPVLMWCAAALLERLLRPRNRPGFPIGYDLRALPDRGAECGAGPTAAAG